MKGRLGGIAKDTLARLRVRMIRPGRIYVLPTRFGAAYLLMLLGMLWGSSNYQNNLGFVLTFLLAGAGLASLLSTHRNLGGISLESARPAECFAPGPCRLGVRLHCPQREHRMLRLRLAGGPESVSQSCGPGRVRAETSFGPVARGRCPTGQLTVSSVYPLGLFRAWRVFSTNVALVVYPRPMPGRFSPAPGREGDGEGEQAAGPGSEDYAGLWPYRPGDPPGRVAWKASSRGLGLYTKHFAALSGKARIFDYGRVSGDVETRLGILCRLVLEAHEDGVHYGLTLPGRSIAPGAGPLQRKRCLEALANYVA